MCEHVYMCVCMCINCLYSLKGYSKVDCTICGKEWNIILGETDAKGTEELPV